jgi:glycosyltransferase involved in cell wall biosynthesis
MKIALVYPHSIIPVPRVRVFDALAIVNYEIARRLAKDHEVMVYSRRGPGDNRTDHHEGVTFRRVSVAPDRSMSALQLLDHLGVTPAERPFRLRWLYYAFFAAQVALDLRKWAPDVIHIHGPTNFIPVMHFFNAPARIVLHAHDYALVDFDRELILRRLSNATLVLGCSNFVVDACRRRFPEIADRCHTLHNGVDRRFFAIRSRPEQSQTVLFVGRLSPEKGVHVLVDAFTRVAGRHGSADLRLVGPLDVAPKQFVDPLRRDMLFAGLEGFYAHPQSYLTALERSARWLGSRVRFEGPVANNAIAALHADAGLFVFPSIWQEPFGIPLIEAMAAGLPVIATTSGAFPEIVQHGVTGLLVERGNPEGLADAIARLLADPSLRVRMGAAGRARAAELFTWDRAVARLVELYDAAMKDRRTCAPPQP